MEDRTRSGFSPVAYLRMALMLFGAVLLTVGCDSGGGKEETGSFRSGGLGLTKAEWETRYKHKERDEGYDIIYYHEEPNPEGYRRSYLLEFWRTQDHVTSDSLIRTVIADPHWVLSDTLGIPPDEIERRADEYAKRPRTITPANYPPPPLENVRPGEELLLMAARALMPPDAEFQRAGVEGQWYVTEIYHSKSLETRYKAGPSGQNPWGDKPPGMIFVSYTIEGDGMSVEAGLDLSGMPRLPTATPGPTDTPLPTPVPTGSPKAPEPVQTRPRPVETTSAP